MLLPVVCFTCGLPLGDVAVLFRHLRAARVREALDARDTAPTQAMIDRGLQLEVGDILDGLGITEWCCRAHLVSGMVYSDYY